MICRQDIDRAQEKKAHWKNLNKIHTKQQTPPATTVAPLPLINAKADDHNTINTVFDRAQHLRNKLGDSQTWMTMDQAIYKPAHEVKWTRGEELEDVNLRMRALHTSNIHMATIGDHVADSELTALWKEARIAGDGEL